ncbi:MAG: D-glycero-beta-D-manno-heptose 1,7-bisphosphate 7-phosphatase [Sulfuricella sp.]|nr:D-glycero-beta-D-manno-heptose 1,7-bisphosphate 7-phosphatase [Gammaproteobacteria bacterium]
MPQLKLIILDRDGVVNYDSDQFIKSPDEWRPIPGSLDAIARLNQAGFKVVLATNQSGVGRGLFDMAMLNTIHDKMNKVLAQAGARIDALFFCPHAAESDCGCRKPKPGMFQEIGERFNISLAGVPCIGDSLRDLQAAAEVGGQPILVLTGKGRLTQEKGSIPENTLVFADLSEAVKYLIQKSA